MFRDIIFSQKYQGTSGQVLPAFSGIFFPPSIALVFLLLAEYHCMFKEPIISIHISFRMCKAMNGIVGIDDDGSSILSGLVLKLKIRN